MTMAKATASRKPMMLLKVSFSIQTVPVCLSGATMPGKLLGGNAGSGPFLGAGDLPHRLVCGPIPPDLGPGSSHDGIRRFEGGTCAPHQPDGEPAGGSARALFADPRETKRDARLRHALAGGLGRI